MRILIAQRSLSPPGGGNAVAAWMVHALSRDHEVATITARPWSPAETNAYYGTSIPERGVAQHLVKAPGSWIEPLAGDRGVTLRMALVLREARRLAGSYRLLISADNYAAFTKPGMQYVYFPSGVRPRPARLAPLVNLYFAFCERLVGIPWSAAENNVTLTTSAWTAARLERDFNVRSRVLYPPVVDPGAGLPWAARRNAFLCIGRFTGSKRIEAAASIVRRVRAEGLRDARLIIVGSPVDRDYTARLHRLAERDRDWMEFRQDISREETNRLIGECRYGLQAMVDEHFGMATAELAKGGCVVFAHDSGGTREVLGDSALLWTTEDEAVARISAIVRDAATRDAVRSRLLAHACAFSVDRFCDELRELITPWVVASG